MSFEESHPLVQQMLAELHRQTGGDLSAKVSMFTLGQSLGIDREAAQEAGQALIASGLAVIVSLSGAISITAEGLSRVDAGGASGGQCGAAIRLGDEKILSVEARSVLESVTADIKSQAGRRGWPFEALSEITADLRTLDAQLQSPRPKTAIVRACLQSIAAALSRIGAPDLRDPVAALLGH